MTSSPSRKYIVESCLSLSPLTQVPMCSERADKESDSLTRELNRSKSQSQPRQD